MYSINNWIHYGSKPMQARQADASCTWSPIFPVAITSFTISIHSLPSFSPHSLQVFYILFFPSLPYSTARPRFGIGTSFSGRCLIHLMTVLLWICCIFVDSQSACNILGDRVNRSPRACLCFAFPTTVLSLSLWGPYGALLFLWQVFLDEEFLGVLDHFTHQLTIPRKTVCNPVLMDNTSAPRLDCKCGLALW